MASPMKRRNFFLPERIWTALQDQAMAKQTTISEALRQLLVKALKLDEQK